jgi:hypothetical protein
MIERYIDDKKAEEIKARLEILKAECQEEKNLTGSAIQFEEWEFASALLATREAIKAELVKLQALWWEKCKQYFEDGDASIAKKFQGKVEAARFIRLMIENPNERLDPDSVYAKG